MALVPGWGRNPGAVDDTEDPFGVSGGKLDRHATAHGVTHDDGVLDAEVIEEHLDPMGQRRHGDLAP